MDNTGTNYQALTKLAITAALEAGKAIMEVYQSAFEVETKEDNSPLTLADWEAHKIICDFLVPTEIYILSEEGESAPFKDREGKNRIWLVDPLDGTKEFVNRNGEFTVNIALIEQQRPVLGVVWAPVKGVLYASNPSSGAMRWRLEKGAKSTNGIRPEKLPMEKKDRPYTVVASRSHKNPETKKFIGEIEKEYGSPEIISAGSSLKLCLVAEGSADIYPRPAPTMEWDTAAGDAICRHSGCSVVDWDSGKPLQYNKENLLNPHFLVKRDHGK